MKGARLIAPEMVLGSYPERHEPKLLSPLTQTVTGWFARRAKLSHGHGTRFVSAVREYERELAHAPVDLVRKRTHGLRAQLARAGFTDIGIAEALAIVSVACGRILGSVPYDSQLVAARIMLGGHLAEMATGEGKTLAAALTAATAALAGIPVHVVTANDYLVTRDATALRPLYHALGLTSGLVTQELDTEARRQAYSCDVTYCTAKELVFDYLRDRVSQPQRNELEERAARLARPDSPGRLLRGLCMAIVDEADSVLIDEARMPLILSQAVPAGDCAAFQHAWKLSAHLRPDEHFILDGAVRRVRLTDSGRVRLQTGTARRVFKWLSARHCEDAVVLALNARHLLERGRDYLVKEGRVHIIDETSGRAAHGRSWSQGLHQLVEIKERCAVSPQVVPLIQITYQRFFPRYLRLCGVSGTLLESRGELFGIYGRQVWPVALRRPNLRKLLPSRVFASVRAQRTAVIARVRELHAQGRPVLVGTTSVTESETLSGLLRLSGLPHAVLNARQDRDEAQIVADAGRTGAITIATNMAGRGTDIILGAGSAETGGLHVICCQQNAARRIDRQLVGRCARQGDPGSAEIYIALDGPLLAHHWLARVVRICTRREEMRHSWLGALALRLAQYAQERRQRTQRELLVRRDAQTSDWFAFSGPEH
jgi:preprotein translocase subunit SecA